MQASRPILFFFKKLQSTILSEDCHEKEMIFFLTLFFSRALKQHRFEQSNIQKYQHAYEPVCVQKHSRGRDGEMAISCCKVHSSAESRKEQMSKSERQNNSFINNDKLRQTWCKRRSKFKEKASTVPQALLCAVSGVFPVPRWSTPPAETQHLRGRSWSPWCWWRSPPWARWAPPSVWRSPSPGTGSCSSPGSHVTRTASAW